MDPSYTDSGEPDIAQAEGTTGADLVVRRRGLGNRVQLLGLAVVVSSGRWLFAADRRIFHMMPDEVAIAGMARWFSGTADWNMMISNTWQPGYSLVLAPLFWVFESPIAVYRAMIMVNALLGGLAAVQLALLLRRMVSLTLMQCIVISGLVSLMPSALSGSAHVWAEPPLVVLFLATLSTSITAAEASSPYRWHLPILMAALGYLMHGRFLPLLPVTVGLAVVFGIRRRTWRHIPTYLIAGAVSYESARLFSEWVFSRVWEAPLDVNTAGSTLTRAQHVGQVLDALAGQLWYQLVSTAFLIVLGAIVLVNTAARRSNDPWLSATTARITLALLAPLVATSAVFMSDRARPDQLVYGRYNDSVLPIVVALGAGHLIRAAQTGTVKSLVRPLGVSAVIALQLGIFVRQFHAKQLSNATAVKPMIAGIASLMGSSTRMPVLSVTCIAVFTMLLLLAVAGRSRRTTGPITVFAVLLVIVAGIGTHHSFEPRRNELASASEVTEIREVLAAAGTIGVAFVPLSAGPSVRPIDQLSYSLLYAWYVPEMNVRVDVGLDDDVGPFVFSPDNDLLLLSGGGVIIWEDPERKMALWKEPEG